MIFYCLTLAVVVSFAPLSVHAEIYKYRAKDGSYHFTDRPMSRNYRLIWRSGKTKSRRGNYSLAKMRENKTKLTPIIESVAKDLRLHPGLLHAMVRVESAYNPKAVSKKGAQGLMQLMPATASRYGVKNSYDPKQNLEGGAQYLSDLLILFEYDIRLALAAYNAGENAVKKYGNKIPPFPETINYVDKVMGEYERNRLAMLE
ncbi:MAG: lytic transglycosylase domain-containing protein [Candidatus Thiodiazotropha sp. (ex Monitilora ramsayi)]|nr:lytic transglycosylase domain-containing protein [Candidatus Thiodiazotropha sp. (ex Monitilora ramsayi)]